MKNSVITAKKISFWLVATLTFFSTSITAFSQNNSELSGAPPPAEQKSISAEPLKSSKIHSNENSTSVSNPTVVKIGCAVPLTGSVAHLGQEGRMAAQMAIDDLNLQHAQIGGKDVVFELVNEDDASDLKQVPMIAQKLISTPVSAVLGHLNSGTSILASKIYFKAGIPQISPATTATRYTRQGFSTTFRLSATDDQLSAALAHYSAKVLKVKAVALIDDRTAYGQGLADSFKKDIEALGIPVVDRQFTSDKSTDFRAVLTQIKSKQPDLIFLGAMDATAGSILRQLQQLGVSAFVLGGDAICTSHLPTLSGGAVGEGKVICGTTGVGLIDNRSSKLSDFRDRFRQKTGSDYKLYAPYMYDAVNILVAAMQKANSSEPSKFLPELKKISFDGITGNIVFDAHGDLKEVPITLYTYRNGKREGIQVIRSSEIVKP